MPSKLDEMAILPRSLCYIGCDWTSRRLTQSPLIICAIIKSRKNRCSYQNYKTSIHLIVEKYILLRDKRTPGIDTIIPNPKIV